MSYAKNTTVNVSKTQNDIYQLITHAGADQYIFGVRDNIAVIGFTLENRQIRFMLPLPDKNDPIFWYTPERRNKRTKEQAAKEWEQACKSKWRSLYLIIKAKLEAVESGISTIEREFFYDIVLPDGRTCGELMAPQIEQSYETGSMPTLLPFFGEKN